MSSQLTEENLKRQYIIDLLDPLRRDPKYSSMTVSELEKALNDKTDDLKLINPQKYLKIYKSDLSRVRDDELAHREYLLEKKRIEIIQMESSILRKIQELDQRELRLKEREMKLKMSPSYPTPLPYSSPRQVYRQPDPVYRERLIEDSEEEQYQRAIKESLEETQNINVEELEDVIIDDFKVPDLSDTIKSKYDFLKDKPDSMTDDILDELHEVLKKEDPSELRKFIANPKKITAQATQWILSLELNGTKLKQLIASKNLTGAFKILEK